MASPRPTTAPQRSSINAPFGLFHAEVASPEAAPAEAGRLILLPDNTSEVSFSCATNVVFDVRLDALLNGVMSYNNHDPAVWTGPSFDNAAASAEEGPLQQLFGIEVGTVDIKRPSEQQP